MSDWINKAIMGLLLSALLSCSGYILYLRNEISNLNDTVSDRDSTIDKDALVIDRYASNDKKTAELIATFQKSLKDVQEMADQKAKEISEAIAASEKVSKEHESYSATLLATIPKSSNMCKEADDMINSYLAKERGGK